MSPELSPLQRWQCKACDLQDRVDALELTAAQAVAERDRIEAEFRAFRQSMAAVLLANHPNETDHAGGLRIRSAMADLLNAYGQATPVGARS